jgi:hypothetical protein
MEVQVDNEGDYPERAMFLCFHFYELPKKPKDVSKKNMLLLWLALFKADTEEELEEIKALEVPVMSQVIDAYYTITASSEFCERERLWEKARHDEAQALENAEKRGEERYDKKWQSVVEEIEAENERLRKLIT